MDESRYNTGDLVQIKIPLHLPYYTSQTDFERIEGEVTYRGVYYNYVKRKVANDTLYILCLPNEAKSKLHGAQTDFANNTNDLPSGTQHAGGKKTNTFSEHQVQLTSYCFVNKASSCPPVCSSFTSPLAHTFLSSNFQPPEATF